MSFLDRFKKKKPAPVAAPVNPTVQSFNDTNLLMWATYGELNDTHDEKPADIPVEHQGHDNTPSAPEPTYDAPATYDTSLGSDSGGSSYDSGSSSSDSGSSGGGE